MADPAFAGTVDELTAKHQVAASMLGLDIREPSVVALASTEATLNVLEERDVVAAIDDFGAGPSNLALLQRLPIAGLKLAPAIVAALGDPAAAHPSRAAVARDRPAGRESAALVRALIELGRALDLTVVAQGVETEAQLLALRALGCAYAQGPFLGGGAPTEVAVQFKSPNAGEHGSHSPNAREDRIDAAPAAEVSTAPIDESLWAPGTVPGGGDPGS